MPKAPPQDARRVGLRGTLSVIGPGLALAATGVGAGDLVAATVSGTRYGMALVWTAVVGAVLKLALTEGLARWQLATGTTIVEGWCAHLGRPVKVLFGVYLLVWSFVVGGALIAACGVAAHAIVPALPVGWLGLAHTAAAAGFVLLGGYRAFERAMKLFVGLMALTIVGTALVALPPPELARRAIEEASLPGGSVRFALGVIGGVGGSLTLLSYGTWIREKGWTERSALHLVRIDLAIAYTMTAVFGIAIMALAALVLAPRGEPVEGQASVLRMAALLGETLGPAGTWIFLIGFWGAVFTSMIGVWQSVPAIFADFLGLVRGLPRETRARLAAPGSRPYRAYLAWLALAPSVLLVAGRPVGLIVLYSVVGSLFMPFVAATLLVMNGRRSWVGPLANGWPSRLALLAALGLFVALGTVELAEMLDLLPSGG
jgi:Mn2+/Fe2+ NRAMP family transporter